MAITGQCTFMVLLVHAVPRYFTGKYIVFVWNVPSGYVRVCLGCNQAFTDEYTLLFVLV